MDNNKYYIPSTEELIIGYECEIGGWEKQPGYKKFIVDEDQMQYACFLIRGARGTKDQPVRVPYLTAEQLEQEGWKNKGTMFFVYRTAFEKDNYFLILDTYDPTRPCVEILYKDPTKDERMINPHQFRVTIPCKSINELRFICRQLGL